MRLLFTIIRTSGILLFSLGISLCIFEIILRFLPVAEVPLRMPLDEKNPVVRFEPRKEITYSLGWNFYHVSYKKVNDDGFLNENDYNKGGFKNTTNIVVIGDSFVEALQVDSGKTFFEILDRKFRLKGIRFISFGVSGAQLPTYLSFLRYAESKFSISGIIFVIINNDFDESFFEVKKKKGYYYFDDSGSLKMVEYYPSKIRRILVKFSLVRYLYFNLNLPKVLYILFKKEDNVTQTEIENRIKISKKAIDIFFKLLPDYTSVSSNKILFILDAMRPIIYGWGGDKINISWKIWKETRNYFISKATQNGYKVIDLHTFFANDYKKHRKRFDFPTDMHWNEYAHQLVASIIEVKFVSPMWGNILERKSQF